MPTHAQSGGRIRDKGLAAGAVATTFPASAQSITDGDTL
jgi:hypothetical protein